MGSKGIPCIALDTSFSIGAFSKYSSFHNCPDPKKDEKGFIDFLYKICVKQPAKPVLFPTNDEWAFVTSKYKKKLSEVSYPCVSDFETINCILSKDYFYELGQKRKYYTPMSWDMNSISSIKNRYFPIVAKPKYKTLPSELYSKRINSKLKKIRLVVINNKEELSIFINNYKEILKHLVFQEYIFGNSSTMYTVGIFSNSNYEIKALFTGRKVRGYPADIGDNILGESFSLPDYLIENTKRIVKEMKYEGIAEFEYKLNVKTEEFRLIEINPRPWSWIGITPYCDVNIPYIAYNSLLGNFVTYKESSVNNGEVKYIKLFQDFFNCMIRYKFNYEPWNLSYKEWKKTISAKKLIIAEWNKKDYGVLIASIPYLIGKIFFQKWKT